MSGHSCVMIGWYDTKEEEVFLAEWHLLLPSHFKLEANQDEY